MSRSLQEQDARVVVWLGRNRGEKFNRCHQDNLPEWEINQGVQFIPHVAAVGEAFQVDHQHRRQRPQVQLLGGLLVLLAVRTVPEKAKAIK